MSFTYLEALRLALDETLSSDPHTLLLGEDIGTYGGAFKLTDGFLEQYGSDRIIDTPIAEGGIIGAGIGLAMMGMKPIIEMQFMDFISCGFNQITNFAAKCHYRWGQSIPIVIRGPGGGLVGGGPFHSQSIEMFFVKTPGLKVVCPSDVNDAYSLMLAAIDDPDPVIFIEHKALYRAPHLRAPILHRGQKGTLGKAAWKRKGSDLTLISYGALIHRCLEAAEHLAQDGIDVSVLDLRTLNPLDEQALIEATKTTHKILIVHEDTRTGGLAGEISMRIQENAFEWLDAPIQRLTAPDTPVPYHAQLEAVFAPSVQAIQEQATALFRY
jgi:2-oxoisovalerate dehydrogenase E1 component beta subunit